MKRVTAALIVVVVVAGLAAWGIAGLGRWLVVVDPLERSTAIVVLSGGAPHRAIEGGEIFREGWAPEVWITKAPRDFDEELVARLGLKLDFGDEGSNRLILARLGVPPSAIRTLTPGSRNTAEEVTRVAAELARVRGDRVIIVTSKSHTRRVRATWHALIGKQPRAIVRYASLDRFDGSRWWEHTDDALAVSREIFGLLNVWVGFPVRPDAKRAGASAADNAPRAAGTALSPSSVR